MQAGSDLSGGLERWEACSLLANNLYGRRFQQFLKRLLSFFRSAYCCFGEMDINPRVGLYPVGFDMDSHTTRVFGVVHDSIPFGLGNGGDLVRL